MSSLIHRVTSTLDLTWSLVRSWFISSNSKSVRRGSYWVSTVAFPRRATRRSYLPSLQGECRDSEYQPLDLATAEAGGVCAILDKDDCVRWRFRLITGQPHIQMQGRLIPDMCACLQGSNKERRKDSQFLPLNNERFRTFAIDGQDQQVIDCVTANCMQSMDPLV